MNECARHDDLLEKITEATARTKFNSDNIKDNQSNIGKIAKEQKEDKLELVGEIGRLKVEIARIMVYVSLGLLVGIPIANKLLGGIIK